MVNTASDLARRTAPVQRPRPHAWAIFAAAICGLWLSTNTVMSDVITLPIFINDLVCGTLIFVLSLMSFGKNREWLRWPVAATGTWLLFAPLTFWAPSAFRYDGSTLLGALVITFAFLIPGQPGAKSHDGPEIPPGWSYNPSTWEQRGPIIVVSVIGFFLARYLAAYQLGYISTAWDPFFGDGTERVLKSEISEAFLVSDAGLGAQAYLVEVLLGFLGGANRWLTMPWAVILFVGTIVPIGVTSIVLLMLQPVAVGAWCTICLVAAADMLIVVPYALDELVATVQYLKRRKEQGDSFWRTLFWGGTDDFGGEQPGSGKTGIRQGFAGVNFPLTLAASTALGIWIMASPAVLGIAGSASDSQHLTGALIVTIAVVAMGEPSRAARFLNVACGIWLALSLFFTHGFPPEHTWTNILVGLALVLLSLPRGKIEERYGAWDKLIA